MKKSYNIGAQMVAKGLADEGGEQDLDDMEIVDQLGLDPKLAYTPGINEAALQATKVEHVRDLLQGGYSEQQAQEMANKGMTDSRELLKKLNKFNPK